MNTCFNDLNSYNRNVRAANNQIESGIPEASRESREYEGREYYRTLAINNASLDEFYLKNSDVLRSAPCQNMGNLEEKREIYLSFCDKYSVFPECAGAKEAKRLGY